jgi:hypothetical protein
MKRIAPLTLSLCLLSGCGFLNARRSADIQMYFIAMYIDEDTCSNKAQYKRIRKVVKRFEKLNLTDTTIIYRYLQMIIKNNYLFDPGA